MNETWRIFLQSQDTAVNDFDAASAASGTAPDDCYLCDLSHLGLIEVGGTDAAAFLQGQFTNDVRNVTANRSQLSAYCTPKGRMLAMFRLFRRGDALYLQLPRSMLQATLKRLSMFVLRSQVTLADASDRLVCVGLAGACADDLLAQAGAHPGDETDAASTADKLTVLRVPGVCARFELIAPTERMQELWQHLATRATVTGAQRWAWMDIRAAIPSVLPETSEAFVPQMANLERVGGVSFTKGCYTGQEVIARSEYLGKLKRRMYLAHATGTECPKPGDELYSPLIEAGQAAGKIVDAQAAPDGGYDMLAVLQSAATEADAVFLGEGGAKLTFLALPYAASEESGAEDQGSA